MLRRFPCLVLLLAALLLSGPSCGSDSKAPKKGPAVPDPDAAPKPAPAGAKAG